MPTSADPARIERRLAELGSRVDDSAGLHGLYAAAALLVGLLLPVAQVQFNRDDVPERYTALGLAFSLNGEYEVDHPTWIVIAALLLTTTAVTAIVAFLLAAGRQDRTAATVALTSSALLPVVLMVANTVISLTDIESGSDDDPLTGWTVGCWVLLLASLAGCWIGRFLRDQFDT